MRPRGSPRIDRPSSQQRRNPTAPLMAVRGFSLVEMLVTLTVTSLVLGSALSMMQGLQITDADFTLRANIQQTGRVALDWIERDLMRAGIGYNDLVTPFPTIVPLDGGGIEIRSNPSGASTYLTSDLRSGKRIANVADATGFVVGDPVLIYDAVGQSQQFTVQNIAVNPSKLILSESASTTFEKRDGTAVAPLETVRYWIEPPADAAATATLMRQVNEDPAQPLADNALVLNITYIDDSDPPRVFVPDSDVQMLRIRAVEASLRIDATEERLDTGEVPSVAFTTRVVPRAISMITSR